MPLPTLKGPWTRVGIDFIIDLLYINLGCDAIMIIINYFTKMAHFKSVIIKGPDKSKRITALTAAKVARRHIF